MNHKVTLAVSAALMSMSMHSAAELAQGTESFDVSYEPLRAVAPISINKTARVGIDNRKFIKEKNLENKEYIYIVHLENDSVALYEGGIQGLEATNPHSKAMHIKAAKQRISKDTLKLDVNAPEVKAYASYLESKHNSFITKAKNLSSSIDVLTTYKYGFNGVAIKALPGEAERIANLPGVKYVERDQLYTMDTDTGPGVVGAPAVWDGSATGVGAFGEGMVVGIIDSGINTDHPSFADVGGDGYDHTNPRGQFYGDCAGDHADLCNDKLIGVYSYPVITDNYDDTSVFPVDLPKNGEDYGGHGTHVAGTVAGNILYDVAESLPEFGSDDSAGVETGFVFDRVSGVAPHANIISYQVCFGGRSDAGDTYGDCPGAAIAAGIESAIIDGVDVINYSISGGGFPWNSATEMAYLSARNAGIFVATSAGNGGPGAATTSKHAPWYTAVAATEHGRSVSYAKELTDFTGGDTTLETLTGNSNSGGITASIVYAGDYTNANDPDNDPAQCLQPFPEGTFSGEIVVCDRGSIARVDKAVNAASGGAGGFVLANVTGGADNIANDIYVVPGIHIDAAQSELLRAWLASGEGHMATITAADGTLEIDPDRVDVLASFSSKGPNSSISTLTPTVGAPGVNIYAAYADQQFGHDGHTPAAGDYNYLSGTSMASPHVAGAAALVKSAQPTWTPDNIRSALAMTAEMTVKKEDGVTPGDWFDAGSGRIRADLAAQSGLVMDELASNYADANPNEGGDPRTLNLPSITDNNCVGVCSWTRTVTATKAGTWTTGSAAVTDGLGITVSPATFELEAGESQEITVSIDAFGAPSGVWSFGLVTLTSDSSPDLHMPVSIIASTGDLPSEIMAEAHRNQDSHVVKDVTAVEITDFQVQAYGLTKASKVMGTVAQDSDNGDFLDDLTDGLMITEVVVPEGATRIKAQITASESPDLDLWLLVDANGDGIPTGDELVAYSATASALESVDVMAPPAGNYWIIVQNWAASGEGAMDAFTMMYGVVGGESTGNMSIEAPSAVPQLTPFDMRLVWDLEDAQAGDYFIGAVSMGTDADNPMNLGMLPVDLMRGEDDVQVTTEQMDRVNPGDVIDYAVEVLANFTAEDRDYEVSVTLPDGVSLVDGGSATVDGNTLTWMLSQPSLLGAEPTYSWTSNATDPMCKNPSFGPFTGEYLDLAAFGITPSTLDGDTVEGTFGVNATFLGEVMNGVTVTDDGFVTIGSSTGGTPWVNQYMPDGEAPNAVVAPFWRDLIFDTANGAHVSVATAGAAVTIIEWDNMTFPWALYGFPDYADVLDFQIVFMNQATLDQPHIIFSYDNVTHQVGSQLGVTIGYENAEGTSGANAYYIPYFGVDGDPVGDMTTDVVDGLQLCAYLTPVADEPEMLNFSVSVDAANTGGPVQMLAMSDVTNNAYTTAAASAVEGSVQVEGAPMPTIGGEVVASLEVTELMELALPGAVTEPNGDDYDIVWTQVEGPAAVIAGNGLANAILMAPEVSEDSMIVLEMTVTDENGNEAVATANVMVKNNLAPTLSISAPASVGEGEVITISASANDPEGDSVSFTINGVPGSTYSTTAPGTNSDTSVTFTVTATDGLNTVTETVSVTVTDKSGGSMGWIALLLIPAIYLRRRKLN